MTEHYNIRMLSDGYWFEMFIFNEKDMETLSALNRQVESDIAEFSALQKELAKDKDISSAMRTVVGYCSPRQISRELREIKGTAKAIAIVRRNCLGEGTGRMKPYPKELHERFQYINWILNGGTIRSVAPQRRVLQHYDWRPIVVNIT